MQATNGTPDPGTSRRRERHEWLEENHRFLGRLRDEVAALLQQRLADVGNREISFTLTFHVEGSDAASYVVGGNWEVAALVHREIGAQAFLGVSIKNEELRWDDGTLTLSVLAEINKALKRS